jgi:hypothetical protein
MQGGRDSEMLAELKAQWPTENWTETQIVFESHITAIPSAYRQIVIDAYAAPVDNQLAQMDTALSVQN